MKLYIVSADDYGECWGAEIFLHGVFDNYDKAKEYVLKHYKDCYCPNYDKTLDNFVKRYIDEVELNNPCDVYLGGHSE